MTASRHETANEGQVITTPEEALKDPIMLDGYKQHHKYTEYDLESGIIDHHKIFARNGQRLCVCRETKALPLAVNIIILT